MYLIVYYLPRESLVLNAKAKPPDKAIRLEIALILLSANNQPVEKPVVHSTLRGLWAGANKAALAQYWTSTCSFLSIFMHLHKYW